MSDKADSARPLDLSVMWHTTKGTSNGCDS